MAALPPTLLRKLPRFVDGYQGTAVALSTVPAVEHPFAEAPTPDIRPQVRTRRYGIDPRLHRRRIATRTSYTNLLLASADFDSASWTEHDLVATDAQAANLLDGTVDVATLMETATTATHYLDQALTLADTTHVFSVFVKANGRSSLVLEILRTGPAYVRGTFDLASGTASAAGVTDTGTAGIVDLGDGWFRCWVTSDHGGASSTVRIYSSSAASFLGDVTKGLFVWGAQIETAATPGPYIATTAAARPISAPDVDALANPNDLDLDPFAYLVAESALEIENASRGIFTRSYARIPADQVFPATRLFDRPNLHGLKSGSTYAVSFDEGLTCHLFTSRKTIASIAALTSATKAVTGTVGVAALVSGTGTVGKYGTIAGTGTVGGTGTVPRTAAARSGVSFGSYTISYKFAGSTSTFSTSAGALAIKAAIDHGAYTVFVAKSDFEIVLQATAGVFEYIECTSSDIEFSGAGTANITIKRRQDTAAVLTTTDAPATTDTRATLDTRSETDTRATLDTATGTDTHALLETYYPEASVRAFTTSANHLAAVGDYVAFYQGDRIVALSLVITQNGTTGFTCLLKDVAGADFAAATCVFSSAATTRILNGAIRCSGKRTQKFYLPGVTAGITTAADIVPPATYATAQGWFDQVVAYLGAPANSSYVATEVADLAQWRGPILMQEILSLQLSDAIRTQSI